MDTRIDKDLYLSDNNDSYVGWLKSFTIDETMESSRRPTYDRLLMILWDIYYEPIVGSDSDRESDALGLRYEYQKFTSNRFGFKQKGLTSIPEIDDIYGPCRVLEVLVALCNNMCEIMNGSDLYNSTSRWFWEIMGNVGLDICDDDYIASHPGSEDVIRHLVTDIVHANNRSDIYPGGWFRIKHWWDIELWYQMHTYLMGYFR